MGGAGDMDLKTENQLHFFFHSWEQNPERKNLITDTRTGTVERKMTLTWSVNQNPQKNFYSVSLLQSMKKSSGAQFFDQNLQCFSGARVLLTSLETIKFLILAISTFLEFGVNYDFSSFEKNVEKSKMKEGWFQRALDGILFSNSISWYVSSCDGGGDGGDGVSVSEIDKIFCNKQKVKSPRIKSGQSMVKVHSG